MSMYQPDWYKPAEDSMKKIDNITEIIGIGIHNIKTVDNFLSDEECDTAMSIINKYKVNYEATHSYPIHSLPEYQFGDKQEENFTHKMKNRMLKTGEALYGLPLIIDQGFQYIIHPTGTYIDPHTDILDITEPDYENDSYEEQLTQFPYLWSGHLSVLAYLNDDYEGGELYFPDIDYAIRPKKRMLITFPGSLHYVHGVAKIESGVRYTLSQWCKFKHFKEKQ